jgi:Protein of unknown function (DUF4446)
MPLEELTTPPGIAALAAAALALIALVVATVLAARLRRLRNDQSVALGGRERRDLVAHAERVENGFVELRDWVEESMRRLDEQTAVQSARIDGCVAYRALVRYDAYEEMSGQQSSSLALLDARRSGTVFSSINHRDQARVYVKQVHEGQPELPLSPEEQQAVDHALSAAGVGDAAPAAEPRSTV